LQIFFFFHVFFDWRFALPLFFLISASPLALFIRGGVYYPDFRAGRFIDLTDLFSGFPARLQRQFPEFPIHIFLFAV
jgi:hypothetical protein